VLKGIKSNLHNCPADGTGEKSSEPQGFVTKVWGAKVSSLNKTRSNQNWLTRGEMQGIHQEIFLFKLKLN